MHRCAWLIAAALLAGAADAGAQSPAPGAIEAAPVQGLSFGSLLPGIPEVISVADAARRGEVVLSGSGTLDVHLLLPAALVSPGGASIPLRFGPRDAALLANASLAPVARDPAQGIRVTLTPEQGAVRLLLGGTALPAPDQRPGTYTTTIVLVVTNAGT